MASITQRIVRSWSSRGLLPILLWPVSALMLGLVALRRHAYRVGLMKAESPGLPVLVVGNRIVGGAGKTPATIAIVQHLQQQGWHPGVLTRGYKRAADAPAFALIDPSSADQLSADQVGDEPLLIWRRTHVPVMVGRDRVEGGRALRRACPAIDILVCDDGLQHLKLARQIEVVVFDERGAGNGWLLPAGPLREPIAPAACGSLVAPPIVLYNAAAPTTPLKGHLAHRGMSPLQPLSQWWSGQGRNASLQPPREGAWAVAGIAHPPKFFDQLAALGFTTHPVARDDHDPYTALPWPEGIAHVILTEKDAVKIKPERARQERPGTQVWVAALDFRPDTSFWQAIDSALARLPGPHL
ncbi:tetraacyldisaccharide 4'-kinase [Aquabacterium sp. CECT 9606]|uniref:tetraacyldisaccharide 4'-kinase n=1 Tax=Aquabacterium sp. CECT 9606 TaxID=2845822 RepID=UPI001E34B904|nr:tetraacyldisaccharide 4'-kinase [Aquabacterium sp. CECT 9606]CAH0352426.1 Tetraacyldisaccharide 4'-kinase [Aquabacterium sp. CECT 9606]